MKRHEVLHPRDYVDKLYGSRKGGGRGLANLEDSVDASIQLFEDYMGRRGRRLITATNIKIDDTKIN